MRILIVCSALCSVSLAALVPVQSTVQGCPPIKPGSFGICAYMCFAAGGHTSDCGDGKICCPTACGGTTCVTKHTTREDGEEKQEDGEEKRAACPLGAPLVNCFVSPCMFATCASHPTASCKADYCGGCHANFYVGGHRVNC